MRRGPLLVLLLVTCTAGACTKGGAARDLDRVAIQLGSPAAPCGGVERIVETETTTEISRTVDGLAQRCAVRATWRGALLDLGALSRQAPDPASVDGIRLHFETPRVTDEVGTAVDLEQLGQVGAPSVTLYQGETLVGRFDGPATLELPPSLVEPIKERWGKAGTTISGRIEVSWPLAEATRRRLREKTRGLIVELPFRAEVVRTP